MTLTKCITGLILRVRPAHRFYHSILVVVIGRGGEQITRLQAESGCKIQMAPDSGGNPDRLCTLTGSREAIARAKYGSSLLIVFYI